MPLYRYIFLSIITFASILGLEGLALNKLVLAADGDSCSFSGSYQQSKELDGLNKPLISKGVLYYDCRHGVIWKTIEPISQSLVLLNDGPSYRVENQQAKKLSSRQSKILGEIINAFISDDLDRLSKHFSISENTSANDAHVDRQIVLLPKRKRLKRAFEKVMITSDNKEYQRIEMLDKKGLRTIINATKNKAPHSGNDCARIDQFSELECGLLLKPTNS